VGRGLSRCRYSKARRATRLGSKSSPVHVCDADLESEANSWYWLTDFITRQNDDLDGDVDLPVDSGVATAEVAVVNAMKLDGSGSAQWEFDAETSTARRTGTTNASSSATVFADPAS
jgi:hypothetical protein